MENKQIDIEISLEDKKYIYFDELAVMKHFSVQGRYYSLIRVFW